MLILLSSLLLLLLLLFTPLLSVESFLCLFSSIINDAGRFFFLCLNTIVPGPPASIFSTCRIISSAVGRLLGFFSNNFPTN